MRNNLLLLHFFSIFLNPQRVTLTYSAMTDGPIDVQLRWANLRAREHHVKGPKKSPRKMVLRRLILRKAEEAKRTTTWAPYRVQCPCLQCQNQPRWILPNFPSVDMGTLSKTVGFSLYPGHWVIIFCEASSEFTPKGVSEALFQFNHGGGDRDDPEECKSVFPVFQTYSKFLSCGIPFLAFSK